MLESVNLNTDGVNQRCMRNRILELFQEVERQYGMKEVRELAVKLFDMQLLDGSTYVLIMNDDLSGVEW